ncbi:hypothetical protein [Nocardia tengchongensis]
MSSVFSWLAVRGLSSHAVLDQLDLIDTGVTHTAGSSQLAGKELPGAWYVVVDYDVDAAGYVSKTPLLERLSQHGDVIACYDSSYGPDSAAAEWRKGQRIWCVEHYCASGETPDHLEYDGDLPVTFSKILASSQAKYADFGFCLYPVAVDLAAEITGFRENREVGLNELAWAN